MARDLILHIGTSKTGSTSIQRVLSRQRREMMAQGVAYPRSPGFERHGYLAMAATTDRRRVDDAGKPLWKGSSPESRLAKFRADFDEEMRALPASVHRVVISAEQFSMTLLDRQSVQNLHDILAPYADRMSVVVWLRRPDQHFTSLYSQMFRWGDAQPPGLLSAKVPPAHGYDFDGLLDRWAAVFGEGSVKPRIFERVPGEKFDIVEDFLALCGLKLVIPFDSRAATANQALSHPAQAVLYGLAEKLRGGRRHNVSSILWQHLIEAASGVPGRSWQPTQDEAREFVARWADNHEAARRRWFPERPTLFSQDFSELPVEPQTVPAEVMTEAALTIMLAMGEKMGALDAALAKVAAPAAEQAGNEQRLHRMLARRVRAEPSDADARLKLAEALHKSGDLTAARRQLDAALRIAPRLAGANALDKLLPPAPPSLKR